jgi:hypothetical protein
MHFENISASLTFPFLQQYGNLVLTTVDNKTILLYFDLNKIQTKILGKQFWI